METSQAWIQAIKDKLSRQGESPSDYAVAKLLNITRSGMSSFVTRRKAGKTSVFSDEVGIRIADYLELDPAYVLACLAAERSKDPAVKAVHERLGQIVLALAKKGRSAAAGILAGILVTYGSVTPETAMAQPGKNFNPEYTLCAP